MRRFNELSRSFPDVLYPIEINGMPGGQGNSREFKPITPANLEIAAIENIDENLDSVNPPPASPQGGNLSENNSLEKKLLDCIAVNRLFKKSDQGGFYRRSGVVDARLRARGTGRGGVEIHSTR